MNEISSRGRQWQEFSLMVLDHIEEYTVPQYGDFPNDQAEGWTVQQCSDCIQRYCNRSASNSRPEEANRDALKIAHYACLMHSKILDGVKDEIRPYESYDFCKSIGCSMVGKGASCREGGCEVYMFHQYLKKNKQIIEAEGK